MSVVSNFGKKVSGKAKEFSQKAKIMSETNSLNNIIKGENCKIDFQYKTIGKLYVEKFGSNPDPDFLEAIEIINASKEKIEQTNQEIIKIKSRFNCPACGEPFKNGALFCSKCGEKLPEIKEEAPAVPDNAQKCAKCGNVLKKDALFCNVCGNKLDGQEQQDTLPEATEAFAPPAEEATEAEAVKAAEETAVVTEAAEESNAAVKEEEKPVQETAEPAEETSETPENSQDKSETAEDNSSGKVCPNCGNKMYDDDIFCNECGTKVE